jgi:lipid A 3-O-deacylase
MRTRRAVQAGRRIASMLAACACAVAAAQAAEPVQADADDAAASGLEGGRLRGFVVQLDNDSLATWPHDDRWYTAGAVLQWIHESGAGGWPARVARQWCGLAACGSGYRVFRLTTFGQQIFNPSDTRSVEAQPGDRPYAAWLALGTGVLVREPDTLRRLEARLGLIGPAALGEQVQNDVHGALGLDPARGWGWQLRPRVGIQLAAAGLRRHRTPRADLDWIHRVGVDAGNLIVQAGAGAMLRYGSPPEGPDWPGEPSAPWAGAGRRHVYAGVELRAVATNRLIDGPAFGPAPVLRPEPFVGDVFVGAALRVARSWQVSFTVTLRSLEFESPLGMPNRDPQRFGTLVLRWQPP